MRLLLGLAAALLYASLQAASPVTHIVMAQKWMEIVRPFHGEHKNAFYSGNLFPDIRYLGTVSRESTHEEGVTLEYVLESPSPFWAGTRLHAWIDDTRESLVVEWDVYRHIEKYAEGHKATLLKMVEDEILYDRLSRRHMMWDIAHIADDEWRAGISRKTLIKWHLFLTLYFSCRPSRQLSLLAKERKSYLNVPAKTVKRWSKVIPYLAQQTELQEYVERLEDTISAYFEDLKERVSDRLATHSEFL